MCLREADVKEEVEREGELVQVLRRYSPFRPFLHLFRHFPCLDKKSVIEKQRGKEPQRRGRIIKSEKHKQTG